MYIGLHNHTDRSNIRGFLDSTNRIEDLFQYTKELGHNGIAITDHDTIAVHMEALDKMEDLKKSDPEKWKDYKLVLGNEIYLCSREAIEEKQYKFWHFILLAKDKIGHQQIRELSTRAWIDNSFNWVNIRTPTYYDDLFDVVESNRGHLIGSTSCVGGFFAHLAEEAYNENPDDPDYTKLIRWVKRLDECFGHGNFFLEMQPSHQEIQTITNNAILKVSEELNIPYIITTDAHYLRKEDRPIHEAFLNSNEDSGKERELGDFYATTYIMSEKEIHEYLDQYIGEEAVQKGIDNTQLVWNMVEEYSLKNPLDIPYEPSGDTEPSKELFEKYKDKIPLLSFFGESEHQCNRHLVKLITEKIEQNQEELANQRTYDAIQECLNTLKITSEKQNTQWAAYLIQVRDLVDACWDAGSLVGCSRGSGLGFVLLYILGITQVNPLKEDTRTYPWRFLNPQRVSVPDIDIDFQNEKRNDVISLLQHKYCGDDVRAGQRRVTKVQTLLTMKSKNAILTACFKKGTLIRTERGMKPIELVDDKDFVFTQEGAERVIAPTYRFFNGDMYQISTSYGFPIVCTDNHKFLVKADTRREKNLFLWKVLNEKGVVEGVFKGLKAASNYVASITGGKASVPFRFKEYKGYKILLNDKQPIPKNEVLWIPAKELKKTDKVLQPVYLNLIEKEEFFYSIEEQKKSGKIHVFIKEHIKIDDNFCLWLGIFLAEGCINKKAQYVSITLNQEEKDLIKMVGYLFESVFGIKKESVLVLPKKDSKAINIQVSSCSLVNFVEKYIYEGEKRCAINKKIPSFSRFLSPQKQLHIVKGMLLGDGYARKSKNGSFEAKITSISYELINDLWQILARNQIKATCIYEHRKGNHKDVYNLMVYGNQAQNWYNIKYNDINENIIVTNPEPYFCYDNKPYYLGNIRSIKKIPNCEETVYCLSMPHENFVVNNCVVHNCRGLNIPVEEAQFLSSFIGQERNIQHTLKQTFYGDEADNIPPNLEFQKLMTKDYPKVWEVAQKIEGLVSGVGSHAGGVILTPSDIVNYCALMKTTAGDIITQYDLHDSEKSGLIKFDLLSIDALQKIHICLNLLLEDGCIEWQGSLKATYEKYCGVYNIERDNPKIWEMINNHEIMSFFQMEKQTGYQAIAIGHPTSLVDLSALNSVMRLMPPNPEAETPLERFGRYKKDITLWYKEMKDYGLTKHEQEVVRKYAEKSYGLLPNQEDFMMAVQDPEIGGFDLLWADRLRKSIA